MGISRKIYRLGAFILDRDRHELFSGATKIHLPNKPFQLLLYLVENRERMVSRTELLEQFWDGKDVYDETLTKSVGAIRKALDDRSEKPHYIETRYRAGYRYIGSFEEQFVEAEILPAADEQTDEVKTEAEPEVTETETSGAESEKKDELTAAPVAPSLAPTQPSRKIALIVLSTVLAVTALALVAFRHRSLENRSNKASKTTLDKRGTKSLEAYQAYLEATYSLNRRNADGMKKAFTDFKEAIRYDPNYALAYAGLADWYEKAIWFNELSSKEALLHAREEATKAVEINPALPEAHIALATVDAFEWDLRGAAREQEIALENNPSNAFAHHEYAYTLLMLGETDKAVAEIRRARELDPLNVPENVDVGEILFYARRYDEAIEALKHSIEMDASHWNAHWDLAQVYERKGMEREAIEEYLKSAELKGETEERIAMLREASARDGVRGFWRKWLELTLEDAKEGYVSPFTIAQIYARLGEKDAAFEWLDRAYQEHSPLMIDLRVEPTFDPLRSDPRLADILRRTGLSAR